MNDKRWTADELIDLARKSGFAVSSRQLERWRKADVLPRPSTKSLGRGRGTASDYPAKTDRYLLQICELKSAGIGRPLERLRFELWWLGYEIPADQVLDSLGWALGPLAVGLRVPGDVDRVDEVANGNERFGLLAHMRQALRRNQHELPDLFMIMIDKLSGANRSFAERIDREVSNRTFAHALNDVVAFDGVKSIPIASTVWGDSYTETVSDVIELLKRGAGSVLKRVDRCRLEAARDAARSVLDTMPLVASTLHKMNQGDGGGLRIVRQVSSEFARPWFRAFMVVVLVASPQTSEQLEEATKTYAKLDAEFRAIDRMMESLPILKGLGHPSRSIDKLSHREKEYLEREVPKYLAEHPEDRELLDAAFSA